MSVNVSLEYTPNPNTLKYTVSERLIERGTMEFTDAAQAAESPLVQRLMEVDGVEAIMLGTDFLTVTVTGQQVMAAVNEAMQKTIKEHLEAGLPVFTGELPEQHAGDDSDIAKQVISLLDEKIRPAVAMDGGDIVFHRFENGIVYLEMKGACSGCPSSTATLKMGVEQFLRERVPEVREVQAV